MHLYMYTYIHVFGHSLPHAFLYALIGLVPQGLALRALVDRLSLSTRLNPNKVRDPSLQQHPFRGMGCWGSMFGDLKDLLSDVFNCPRDRSP